MAYGIQLSRLTIVESYRRILSDLASMSPSDPNRDSKIRQAQVLSSQFIETFSQLSEEQITPDILRLSFSFQVFKAYWDSAINGDITYSRGRDMEFLKEAWKLNIQEMLRNFKASADLTGNEYLFPLLDDLWDIASSLPQETRADTCSRIGATSAISSWRTVRRVGAFLTPSCLPALLPRSFTAAVVPSALAGGFSLFGNLYGRRKTAFTPRSMTDPLYDIAVPPALDLNVFGSAVNIRTWLDKDASPDTFIRELKEKVDHVKAALLASQSYWWRTFSSAVPAVAAFLTDYCLGGLSFFVATPASAAVAWAINSCLAHVSPLHGLSQPTSVADLTEQVEQIGALETRIKTLKGSSPQWLEFFQLAEHLMEKGFIVQEALAARFRDEELIPYLTSYLVTLLFSKNSGDNALAFQIATSAEKVGFENLMSALETSFSSRMTKTTSALAATAAHLAKELEAMREKYSHHHHHHTEALRV